MSATPRLLSGQFSVPRPPRAPEVRPPKTVAKSPSPKPPLRDGVSGSNSLCLS